MTLPVPRGLAALTLAALTLAALLSLTASGALAQRPAAPGSLTSGDIPSYWRTRAERSGYHQTPDYDETVRYCRQMEGGSRWIKVLSYGKSGQGRDLPLVVLSKDRAFTPEAARATGKPILLIQNGIHSGEIEGKDASLALIRDIAVLRTREDLLDSVIVLVLPIFSVDAHERRSKYNRINQNGPDEMGWRSTPIGLNLNRDYLKVETPEMRALIGNVFTRWWPHLLVDNHTTDGADYRYDLTYGIEHGAGTPASVDRWMAEAIEGRVMKRCQELGHVTAPYVSFRRGNDPMSGIDFGNSSPRFSSKYPVLHGRPALLVETHMLKSYQSRVKATYDLMLALLEETKARPRALLRAVADAEAEAVARGREPLAPKRGVVLATRTTDRGASFPYRGVRTTWEKSEILGATVPRYSAAPWDTIIPLYREVTPTVTALEPLGYVVPQEWTRCRELLDLHAVRYRVLARAWSDTVEQARVARFHHETVGREGHLPTVVDSVVTVRRVRAFRAGDVWVPLDQPSAMVAVHLFEAQAPDAMVYWNAFDTVLEQKEYGEDYVVEPLARKMLAESEPLVREFKAKVAADSAFAKDPGARSNWFYTRSPWADPEQNLLPVCRALRRPPDTALSP